MLALKDKEIKYEFNGKNVIPVKFWSKEKAVMAITRFLKDDGSEQEALESLEWLENEYPLARKCVRRLRCYILFEEFLEYEQRVSVYAVALTQLRLLL